MNSAAKVKISMVFALFIIAAALFMFFNTAYVIGGLNDVNDTNQANCTQATGSALSWIPPENSNYNLIWSDRDDLGGPVDGVYWGSCCGDDSSEYLRTQVCSASGQSTNNFNYCTSQANVNSCCLVSSDCVYGYDCYNNASAYTTSGGVGYCESGTWYDCDSTQERCDSCSTEGDFSCGADCWIMGGESTGEYTDTATDECCGDDASEVRIYRLVNETSFEDAGENTYSDNVADFACCGATSDCIDSGYCYNSGSGADVDGDGDTDYCMSTVFGGMWVDCNSDSNCDTAANMGCINHNCVDVVAPNRPTANFSTTTQIELVGYIDEPITVNMTTRRSGNSSNYYRGNVTSGPLNPIVNICQAKQGYLAGLNDFTLINCNSTPTTSQYIKFQRHNTTDYRYYDISVVSQAGQEFAITTTLALRENLIANEYVYLYSAQNPSGYFTANLPFTNFQIGTNYLYIWGTDYADTPNAGPVQILGPIICSGDPLSCTSVPLVNDTTSPVRPSANFSTTTQIELFGYIDEPIKVNITTRLSGSASNYYSGNISSGPLNPLANTCQLKQGYLAGATDLTLINCNSAPDSTQFVKFQRHNSSNYKYNDITLVSQAGQEYAITLASGIRQNTLINEYVYLYNDQNPSGYFETNLSFSNFQTGTNYLYVWGTDYADIPNAGTVEILGPIYCSSGSCTSVPPINDSTAPISPRTWALTAAVNSSTINIIGYINESVNVTGRVRNESSSLSYFETSVVSQNISTMLTSCSAASTYAIGSTNLDLVCTSADAAVVGSYLEFLGHNGTYFERYSITSREILGLNNIGVVLNRPLEHQVITSEAVQVHNIRYPSGWFNISLSLREGTSYVRVFGVDESNNTGSYQEIGPIYYEPSTNLEIWDTTRDTLNAFVNDTITFYANYTNSSNAAFISGADCYILFNSESQNTMTESSVYIYTREFNETGTYSYYVNCSIDGLRYKTASGSIVIYQDIEKPVIWDLPNVVNNSLVRVTGYSNSTLVTANVYTLGDPSSLNSTYISETIVQPNMSSVYSLATEGSTRIYVPQIDFNNGYFTVGRYIQFVGHNLDYFFRYNITSVDDIASPDYAAINITPALVNYAIGGEQIFVYDNQKPLGWFNLSVQLQNTGLNYIAAYNNKSSAGPSCDSQTIYLDTQIPSFSFPQTYSSVNPFTFTFTISDDYWVGETQLNISGGANENLTCSIGSTQKICTVNLNLSQGYHNFTFIGQDLVGNTRHHNLSFLVDTTVSSLGEVNDTGDLTSLTTLNATWSAYIDEYATLGRYEYAIGTAPYPESGWNDTVSWANTSNNFVSAGPLALYHTSEYYFNVRALTSLGNYTNVVSSDGIVYADNTPPFIPGIIDSGEFTASSSQLYASWNSSDDESGLSNFEISIGIAQYPYSGWNSILTQSFNANITSYTFSVPLVQNKTYYFTARAQNGYGVWGQRNSTDGIRVDTTAPLAGWINYSVGNFTTNTVTINFSNGQDNESGIDYAQLYFARLLYRDNTCSGNYFFENLISDITGRTGYSFTMDNGYCYKFMQRVYNNANLSSEYYYYQDLVNYTIIVDSTSPTAFNITDDGSVTYDGTRLHAAWSAATDAESGMNRYEYRVQYTMNNGPRIGLVNWTSVGLERQATVIFELNHSNMSNQYKYFFDVRAYNVLGLVTEASSDGIIYLDIYQPNTILLSVGDDTTYPYNDENFGNISINVSGEANMKCVYSTYDIDYSDSAESCVTSANISSCLISLEATGNYTYHIICKDLHGNGQDYNENIDVTFEAFVYDPIVQTISVDADTQITVKYTNSSGSLRESSTDDDEINTTLFANYIYTLTFYADSGRFAVVAGEMNLSENQLVNFTGRLIQNLSQYNNTNLSLGNSLRYIPRYAYAVEIEDNYNESYSVIFNYTLINVSNQNALKIYQLGFNTSDNSTDYETFTLYQNPIRDTSAKIVTLNNISNFSVFILIEDSQMPETCSDAIDNDGDGSIDEGCTAPNSGDSGGSGKKGSGSIRSGYVRYDTESCIDNETNQDETDVDCGGICAKSKYLKACTDGKKCLVDEDCTSKNCHPVKKICYTPTCADSEKNQGEADIDCGGPCEECYYGPKDTDKDGIPDEWESKYDIDINNTEDAKFDFDDDGLSNIIEYQYNTSPRLKDTDGDGYSDFEEIGKKTNPLDAKSKPASCSDRLKNQGETGIDCGGPCGKCPEVEEPKEDNSSIILFILVGVIVAGIAGGFYYMRTITLQKEKALALENKRKHEEEEKAIHDKEDTELQLPEKEKAKENEAIAILPQKAKKAQEIRIVLTDNALLELQSYVNMSVAKGTPLDIVRKELLSNAWPEYIVDKVINSCGNPDYMKKLVELQDYTGKYLRGFTHEEIRKRLKLSKWQDAEIDLVLNNAHICKNINSLDDFISYEFAKDVTEAETRQALTLAGWPQLIVDKEILSLKTKVKSDVAELLKEMETLFEKGLNEKETRSALLNKGFKEDLVNLFLFKRYSFDANVEKLKIYANEQVIKGVSIDAIKKILIETGWGIDVIDMIVTENFRANDLKYLIALDNYIKESLAKGLTKELIEKELLHQKWADEYIDLVMLEVHIIDDKIDKVKNYIVIRTMKGDSVEKITEILIKVGWARKVVVGIFTNQI
ncbi:MAG: hypothetical protein V1859_11135 [archaeon]